MLARTAVKIWVMISDQFAGKMPVSRLAWVRNGMMMIWLRLAPSSW
jgi:hypothetical protein